MHASFPQRRYYDLGEKVGEDWQLLCMTDRVDRWENILHVLHKLSNMLPLAQGTFQHKCLIENWFYIPPINSA
jgi:hypothetical protein